MAFLIDAEGTAHLSPEVLDALKEQGIMSSIDIKV